MVDQLAASWLPSGGHPRRAGARARRARRATASCSSSAYCASPLCAPSRAALLTGRLPVAHRRVRQRRRAARLRADLRPPPARRRLRDLPVAARCTSSARTSCTASRSGSTTDVYPADLDWTPDWRLPLTERLPWYHTMESVLTPGVCAASMQMDYDDAGRRPGRAQGARPRARPQRPAVPPVRLVHPSARPVGAAPAATGSATTATRSTCRRSARSRARRPTRTACGCATWSAIDEAALRRGRDPRRAARLLRGDLLRRRAHRRGARRARTRRAWPATRSCSSCADHGEMLGERGLWYKMAFFEPGRARAAARVGAGAAAPPGAWRSPVSLLDVGADAARAVRAPGRRGARGGRGRAQPRAADGRAARRGDGVDVRRASTSRRASHAPRRDGPARAPQVRRLRGRSRAALRPRGRPARARRTSRPTPAHAGAVRRAARRRWRAAGTWPRCARRCWTASASAGSSWRPCARAARSAGTSSLRPGAPSCAAATTSTRSSATRGSTCRRRRR